MKTNNLLKAVLGMTFFILSSSQVLAETLPPDLMMTNATNRVAAIIKNDSDIQSGNFEKLSGVVKEVMLPHFDLDRLSHKVLGEYWESASDNQREAFKTELALFISKLYSKRLPNFRNETVEFQIPQENKNGTDVLLTMMVSESGASPEKVYLSMDLVGDEWKIYDISVYGTSLADTYRGQFQPLAKQRGMDVLIQKLIEKNKNTA